MVAKPNSIKKKHERHLLKVAVQKAGQLAGVNVRPVDLSEVDDATAKALTLVLRSLCDKAQQSV